MIPSFERLDCCSYFYRFLIVLLVIFGVISFIVVVFKELLEPNGLLLLLFDTLLLLEFELIVLAQLLALAGLPMTKSFLPKTKNF